jgi:hypothetical protein
MNKILIIITGLAEIDKNILANEIIKNDDSLTIAPIFTTDKEDKTKQYMDVKTVNLSYKNNALFYIYTHDYISIGVTIEDYNNSDIFVTNIREFNNISDKFFKTDDIIVVLADSKNLDNVILTKYKYELKYLNDRLSNVHFIYFTDDLNVTAKNAANTILKYVKCTLDNLSLRYLSSYLYLVRITLSKFFESANTTIISSVLKNLSDILLNSLIFVTNISELL